MHTETRKFREVTYSAQPLLLRPFALFREMLNDLLASRELAWRLFVRDTSSEYRQSLLGYLWIFLSPFIATVPWVFLNSQGIINIAVTEIPYFLYVMVGMMLWQVFAESISMPLGRVGDYKILLSKANFPRETLIISGGYQILFRASSRLACIVIFAALFGASIPLSIFLAPLGILMLLLVGTIIGLMILPLGMLYKDIEKVLPIATTLCFFATPVVYPAPTKWPAVLLVRLNPISPILSASREVITTGVPMVILPFLIYSIISVILLFGAWVVYRVSMPHLVERMTA
jgi:lipopolysaccharide transport system permease protein